MKLILSESQYSKILKGVPTLEKVIVKYLNNMMQGATRTTVPKKRNYGNLRQDWCKDGKEFMSVFYYFGEPNDDEFDSVTNQDFYEGQIFISKNIIKTMINVFKVREKYILNIIAEWYDETYTQEFAKEMNEPYLHINDVDTIDKDYPCKPEIKIPESITDKEMIDLISKSTLYDEQEIINMVEKGEITLEDFYLSVLETIDNRTRRGF